MHNIYIYIYTEYVVYTRIIFVERAYIQLFFLNASIDWNRLVFRGLNSKAFTPFFEQHTILLPTFFHTRILQNPQKNKKNHSLADSAVGLADAIGRREEEFAIGAGAQLVDSDALVLCSLLLPLRRGSESGGQ